MGHPNEPKAEVWQGTLALMVLKTLSAMGPQHGYGIARRIEQTSDDVLSINEGTLYPVLLKLEQEGAIASQWGVSDNNRRAKFYRITKGGQKFLEAEVTSWTQTNDIMARFLALKGMKPRGAACAGPARLLGALTLRRKDRELGEEFASHLELLIEDNIRRGVPPDEARRLARIRFGNVENMKEHYRDQRGLPFVDMAYQDIRYGFVRSCAPRASPCRLSSHWRSASVPLRRSSAVRACCRAAALPGSRRIVAVWENRLDRNRPRNVIGAANFVAWRERNKSFEKLGMVGPARLNIVLNGQPEEIAGFYASADALAAFGTQPQLGRLFTEQEDLEGTDGVIIISHQFWQNRLGGRADVLGQSITASGRPRSIVGVMPERFTIEEASRRPT